MSEDYVVIKNRDDLSISVGLGWDIRNADTQKNGIDLDVHVYMFDRERAFLAKTSAKSEDLNDYALYMRHSGDNMTGVGDGDDEVITLDIGKMPENVGHMIIKVDVPDADNFEAAQGACVRLYGGDGEELLRERLPSVFYSKSVLFCRVSRTQNGDWRAKPLLAYSAEPDDAEWMTKMKALLV